jgi:hypothetical protein
LSTGPPVRLPYNGDDTRTSADRVVEYDLACTCTQASENCNPATENRTRTFSDDVVITASPDPLNLGLRNSCT